MQLSIPRYARDVLRPNKVWGSLVNAIFLYIFIAAFFEEKCNFLAPNKFYGDFSA